MYNGYPSTFQRPFAWLRSIDPPNDPDAVAKVRPSIEKQLAERFPEETEGSGDLRKDFARKRIGGAIDQLQDLRTLGRQQGACQEFLELVELVLAEARAALNRASDDQAAPSEEPTVEDAPPPAAWSKREIVRKTAYDLLPDEFKDI